MGLVSADPITCGCWTFEDKTLITTKIKTYVLDKQALRSLGEINSFSLSAFQLTQSTQNTYIHNLSALHTYTITSTTLYMHLYTEVRLLKGKIEHVKHLGFTSHASHVMHSLKQLRILKLSCYLKPLIHFWCKMITSLGYFINTSFNANTRYFIRENFS